MEKPKVLILGIDGMDQRTTKRMLEEGKLPNLQEYYRRGASRENLDMLGAVPTITPPCWTTLATGAYPGTHGITCYWRQSPESLDAVVYNMDSRFCKAEQLWNVTTRAGKKTLVWHWPGSAWPPSSDSTLLSVVDGTQPGSVNMGIAQLDWEKVLFASKEYEELKYLARAERPAGVGCIIDDLDALIAGEDDDEMMELWWGDSARDGKEIRTYAHDLNDTELMIGAKVAYDVVTSPIRPAERWANAPADALEFTLLTSGGQVRRPGLILKGETGVYERIAVYRNKKAAAPLFTLRQGELSPVVVDEAIKKELHGQGARLYKLLKLDPAGRELKLWISNALDVDNDTLWSPKELYRQVTEHVGPVPPVSLIGGEDAELVRDVFLPSWDIYNQWQADSLKYLIDTERYEVVFSHLHNVDCGGHQFWHLAKTLEPWADTDETFYQEMIEEVYRQTDDYLGTFLPYLDQGWTIFIVSDHGLLVGEHVPPVLGEYSGLNLGPMEELGYTVLKKDADGNQIDEIDWSQTRAVQIRSNHIYLNLKGRDAHGIVDPAEQYELEEQIIDDLYGWRDPETGRRVVGIALRNRDAVVLGLNGEESGDIIFTINEGFNRLHGDGLTTAQGFFETSTTPVFLAAGAGILENHRTNRVIRQVDVVPTVASVLGIPVPADCEGAPVYQILQTQERQAGCGN